MGLTCSQSAPRTKPHLLFGETSPPSIPSLPPARIAAISFFSAALVNVRLQLQAKAHNHHHRRRLQDSNTRGQYRSTVCNVHLYYYVTSTKPLAAGHPSHALPPSFPTDMQGNRRAAALSRQSACLVLALPSEDPFLHDLQLLALCLCLCLTA